MFETTNDVLIRFWIKFINYIPDFFGGLLILLIGLFVSTVLKKILLTILAFFRVDALLNRTRLATQKEVRLWQEVLTELVKWTIIILFLIPTLETWGLSKATSVLNQFLFYLPNVIVAVVIGFVGIIISNLASDLVKHSVNSLGATSANTLSAFSKSTIVFFTILIMMNQLGVAQDLIRIFFTGIVAMIAIAGGLAFGLGGKDVARDLLEDLKKKLGK
ncbi:hypothetical protein A2334_02770 [Candidatus Roizmanbacteria bacterium RIFOXYB2_FULL_38_10]|uniref:Small-conductance mechanosensitive ion channel n=1 Tax=Candidatus Roizmanbacteria bacterium RIFOXYD1_FULL_38_12 TaxID=1802093 RepID=A0A1F7L0F1_9BACT|nr:MAG: hypothetical protein A3K47_02230 [Candidatus Roizmanbacteria bacterium RIFOXYA2_FULL_38_14]OGK63595.1 MAG: hypothetical protein A3K27_02230 [Candidatus Roizmanbacteria bacterium RIFOXYA1_FULL_37_12]OGK65441.1 MAG: hypothetical protein A3K38_02230 [Candidatus Roizmanbacteria bacterium RIFOXYB1_FULL_40_23]OGK69082.1 MAG: hypothetical protein A2334_02770 [Candidatus Roizmanbacteria bacterium RIFOXYB2_FULL_38_10]OGK69846.1 MAG: hypothetical protein A3K21_02235 [Candidatus Roizmanbacteria ba